MFEGIGKEGEDKPITPSAATIPTIHQTTMPTVMALSIGLLPLKNGGQDRRDERAD
ncbi:hypothetical protein [Bradyrhizobium sp. JR3.5]